VQYSKGEGPVKTVPARVSPVAGKQALNEISARSTNITRLR
jgi:hypothetical protein